MITKNKKKSCQLKLGSHHIKSLTGQQPHSARWSETPLVIFSISDPNHSPKISMISIQITQSSLFEDASVL
jgi:hypothetical protein